MGWPAVAGGGRCCRHQVTDIEPAPAPKVIQYAAQAKQCAGCGAVSVGELPAYVRARASYGPETCAQAANLVSGHHIPVYRATLLLCQLADIAVSAGWMAGIRGKAAALVEASGFMDRVRELLRAAPAVHADETPARVAGGTRHVHLACTRYLTCMHTGDRSAEAIDAGQVLPRYQGVIVRDGYAGSGHLTSALHAWCAVHLLRDLKALYDFEPAQQKWASGMAGLLIEARDAAGSARAARPSALDAAVLNGLVTRYRSLAAAGLAANLYPRTATARDARRLACRFCGFEDLILRSRPADARHPPNLVDRCEGSRGRHSLRARKRPAGPWLVTERMVTAGTLSIRPGVTGRRRHAALSPDRNRPAKIRTKNAHATVRQASPPLPPSSPHPAYRCKPPVQCGRLSGSPKRNNPRSRRYATGYPGRYFLRYWKHRQPMLHQRIWFPG